MNNLQEFVAYVKKNQDKMQFGSAGVGAGTHLPCELLNMQLGVKVTHVPYKGAGPVMQDLIGGRIDYFCDTIQTGAVQAKAGTVKGLAVMSPRRVPIIAELATTGEQGVPNVEATVWNGFFLPKNTPDALVRRFNKAMNTMIEDPAIRKRLEELGLEILPRRAAHAGIPRASTCRRRSSAGRRSSSRPASRSSDGSCDRGRTRMHLPSPLAGEGTRASTSGWVRGIGLRANPSPISL